jgi:hypothetical protein
VDRTHAGIAPARDGFRTPDRRTHDGGAARRAGPRSALLLVLVLVLAVVLGACGSGATTSSTSLSTGTPGDTVARAAAHSGAAITLLGQSPFVGPGQAFSLRLAIGASVPGTATLSVTVYQHLTSRSALVETIGGTVVGAPVSSSSALALSALPADPQGGVDLTIPVAAGGTAPAAVAGAPFTADLHCATGECGGVYPVRLLLSAAGSSTGRPQLLTNLVYEDPPATTQRLQVAWVVPVSLPPATASPAGEVAPPAAGAIARVATLLNALAAHASVATTLAPSPATAAELDADTRGRAKAALSQLEALAASATHQSIAGPFVSVDAGALLGAGLPGELTEQVQRGAQSMVAAGVHAVSGTWQSAVPLDQATLAQLSSLGLDHAVLPATTVSGSPFRLTPAQPITLPTGRGSTLDTVLEDPILATHFTDASGPGAVLAANQLLADLALIYYEQPNLATPRGVVTLSPTLWSPDPAFLDAVLSGLTANPVLQPVTLASLFATVPGAGSAQVRRAAPDAATTMPARAIRATRSQVAAYGTAVSDPAVPRAIGDVLLSAESDLLRPTAQASGVAGASAALGTELARLSINSDNIRLTSSTAHVPITIVKSAPYSVTAVMTLSSDKLLFPSGSTRTVLLDRATNAVYVDMRARTGGVFRVTVTLYSPRGGLVLASRQLTVRSMSTSAVAIGLSLGAAAVLLAWWGRTMWRRRGERRGAHARRLRRGPDTSAHPADPSDTTPDAVDTSSGGAR